MLDIQFIFFISFFVQSRIISMNEISVPMNIIFVYIAFVVEKSDFKKSCPFVHVIENH